jgi:hypothetical protein
MSRFRWSRVYKLIAVFCAAALLLVVTRPASATVTDPIVGSYAFNGNGWTGTLTVLDVTSGYVTADMSYDERGVHESVSGSWDPASGRLTLLRPLSYGGVTQTYTLYIGTHVAYQPMFGGYFTQSDFPGGHWGAFATRLPSPPSTSSIDPTLPPPTGIYWINGNGWTGGILLAINPHDPHLLTAEIHWTDYPGLAEHISGTWDSASGLATFVRPLSWGGVTQTYTLYVGAHRPQPIFGGYFTQSDTPGKSFGVYLDQWGSCNCGGNF